MTTDSGMSANRFAEHEHIDMEGNMTFIKADKYKNMHLVPDSTRNKDY